MKKILILAGRYLPGYKDGGPVRTLINLTELLGDEYDFRLVVLDRDHGDTEAYPDIQVNAWNQVSKAKVWYYAPGQMKFALIRQLAKDADLVYLCGFYGNYGYKTLMLHRCGMLFGKPVVVASMGSFSEGALGRKTLKKKTFIGLLKSLGMFDNITWSVTSEMEKTEVRNIIGHKATCMIAEDLPRSTIPLINRKTNYGILRFVFISRICAHKNLLLAIEALKVVQAPLHFAIYGTIEDDIYWGKCKKELQKLPEYIKWEFLGEAPSEQVQEILSTYDAMLFPTKGENYGHVVFEAISVGCIPIISDKTPWNALKDRKAGIIASITDSTDFSKGIRSLLELTPSERDEMSDNGIAYAKMLIDISRENTGYREIFSERKTL